VSPSKYCCSYHIPTNMGKVASTFLTLKENGSNGSWKVIGEVFVLAAVVNFAQFAKYSLQKYIANFILFSDQILRYSHLPILTTFVDSFSGQNRIVVIIEGKKTIRVLIILIIYTMFEPFFSMKWSLFETLVNIIVNINKKLNINSTVSNLQKQSNFWKPKRSWRISKYYLFLLEFHWKQYYYSW
jgi:hypothetical protein